MNREQIVREYFEETELTLEQIGEQTGFGYGVVWKIVSDLYTVEQRRARKARNYSRSKTGNKNPMTGRIKDEHHNWIGGEVSDGNGYTMIIKPDWYTGRKGSKYVFKHSVVMCESLGLTEIPKGFVVHHIDGIKTNNDINNLALLSNAAHSRLHNLLKRVTTIP